MKLTDDELLLTQYLNQYQNGKRRKKTLERRRRDILLEFDCPLSGVKMDGMPKGNSTGDGAATLALKLDAIDTKIKQESLKLVTVLGNIIDITKLLPPNTLERDIIEARYIDCFSWVKTCMTLNISRTPANRRLVKGLKFLLEQPIVQTRLEEFRRELAEADRYNENTEVKTDEE